MGEEFLSATGLAMVKEWWPCIIPAIMRARSMDCREGSRQIISATISGLGTNTAPVSGPLYPKLSTCFEGSQLTQLVQLVTAGRLFPCHEGRVDP